MSILSFIKRVTVQTAVYWASPVPDGYGGMLFDYPREIKCRWEDKRRLFRATNGVELETKSNVLVNEALELQGWLYLGNLADIDGSDDSSGTEINPMSIEGAYEIIAVDKIPLFRSTDKFVNTVYLGFKNLNN